jgi:hypothetical protein
MRALAVVLMLCLPAVAAAQDWALRPSDERLDPAALTAAVSGRTLTFYDDGRSRFAADGAYDYTLSEVNGGGVQSGAWEVTGDGVICIAYENGRARCDMYVRADGRFVVLTADGGRYPVRPE